MSFQVGEWWHEAPGKQFDAAGKRVVVKHLCYGPLETQIWYELQDGSYSLEIHFIEGIRAGEAVVDCVNKLEMLEVLKSEIALCQRYNEPELAALFQVEVDRIEKLIL